MRNRTRASGIAVLIALAACGGETEPVAETEKPTAQIAFLVGASDGTAARRGIDLALAQLNADSAGAYRFAVSEVQARDAATATSECGRLAEADGLVAMIGALGEPEAGACVAAPGAAGLAYVSLSEPSGELCADNLYHVAPLPNQRAAAEETARGLAATAGGPLAVADYFESVQLPANDSFVAASRERDSTAASTPEAARAYDAVRLVAAAVRAAAGADRAAVLAALPSVRVDGPRGPVSFPAGTRFATLHMFVARTGAEGKLEPVSFRPGVAPEPACD